VILVDTNVLVYAYHADSPAHHGFRRWLEHALGGDELLGIADVVASGFLRIVTHPRIFDRPAPVDQALEFVDALRSNANTIAVSPGPRQWEVFSSLCRRASAKGNLVPDAYLAALAIDAGAEVATADRHFARFPGLRWRHPLAA